MKNLFWNLIGFLKGHDKLKFRVEFEDIVGTEAALKKQLSPYNVVQAKRKGVHTWWVFIRTNQSGTMVIDKLLRTDKIRAMEQIIF